MNLRFLAYSLTIDTYNFLVSLLQSIEEFLLFFLKYQFSQNHSFHYYVKNILDKLAYIVQKLSVSPKIALRFAGRRFSANYFKGAPAYIYEKRYAKTSSTYTTTNLGELV